MSRPRKSTPPQIYFHTQSQAYCANLAGRRVRLGKDRAAAEAALERAWAEHILGGKPRTCPGGSPDAHKPHTIDQLILAYWAYALSYYQKNGEPTGQTDRVKSALGVLRELYGPTPIRAFGPLALTAVRDRMATQRRWTRGLVNQSLGCVKRAFKWAAAHELISAEVWHRLQVVEGLRRGCAIARESEPVRPVSDADVAATLPRLNRVVGAMVVVQELCGMRPGEVCALTPGAIDRSGDVWVYRVPERVNKTAHHGRVRRVPIGPKAQEVLAPFLNRPGDAWCFSPAEAVEQIRVEARKRRRTKVQPSQASRRKAEPARVPAACYTPASYARAVARAAARAGVPHWHPNRLRHSRATKLRAQFGIEAARVLLGHSSSAVTEIYAETDLKAALDAARKTG